MREVLRKSPAAHEGYALLAVEREEFCDACGEVHS